MAKVKLYPELEVPEMLLADRRSAYGLRTYVSLFSSAGVGNVLYRVNCNSFVENLYTDHHYVRGTRQNIPQILATVPPQFINDFNDGLNL